jgi:hypothetical protein
MTSNKSLPEGSGPGPPDPPRSGLCGAKIIASAWRYDAEFTLQPLHQAVRTAPCASSTPSLCVDLKLPTNRLLHQTPPRLRYLGRVAPNPSHGAAGSYVQQPFADIGAGRKAELLPCSFGCTACQEASS